MANSEVVIRNYTQLNKYKNKKCEECGKCFVMNDIVHTTTGTRQSRKRYHKECWDSKFN